MSHFTPGYLATSLRTADAFPVVASLPPKNSVFGNSLQNPRHFSARGCEESLELYSILRSDWPTSKQEVLRHGSRFAGRVRRRYFSEGEKRRPEMRLRFAGYLAT